MNSGRKGRQKTNGRNLIKGERGKRRKREKERGRKGGRGRKRKGREEKVMVRERKGRD